MVINEVESSKVVSRKKAAKDIAKLAIPLGVLNFLATVTAIMEVGFMSSKGANVLQASYVVDVNLNFIAALGQLTIQTQPYISEQYGLMALEETTDHQARRDNIAKIIQQSWILAAAVGVPGVILLLTAKPFAEHVFHFDSDVVDVVGSVCTPLAVGVIFQSMVLVDQILVTTTGHEKIVFAFASLDTLVGVFFNYAMVNGKFGFPELGAMSIGVVGASRMFLNWVLYKAYFALSKDYKQYKFFSIRIGNLKEHAWKILKEGFPLFMITGIAAGTRIPITSWVERIGGDRAEVMQVYAAWSAFFGVLPKSFTMATGVYVSRVSKQGNKKNVRRYGFIGLGIAMASLAVPSVLYPIIPQQLCKPFAKGIDFSPEIEENLHTIFLELMIVNLLQTYQTGLVTNLENIHKTLYPGLITAVTVITSLPLSFLAGIVLGLDLLGMNSVDGIGYAIVSILLLAKWQREVKGKDFFKVCGITDLMKNCRAVLCCDLAKNAIELEEESLLVNS